MDLTIHLSQTRMHLCPSCSMAKRGCSTRFNSANIIRERSMLIHWRATRVSSLDIVHARHCSADAFRWVPVRYWDLRAVAVLRFGLAHGGLPCAAQPEPGRSLPGSAR